MTEPSPRGDPPPPPEAAQASARPPKRTGGVPVVLVVGFVLIALLSGGLIGALIGANVSSRNDRVVTSGPGPAVVSTTDTETAVNPTTSQPRAKAAPRDPVTVFLSAPLTIPAGDPGKLSVVLTGPPSGQIGSTVPVVVRNNTDKALERIEVTGTARSVDGSLAGSGSSQGLQPAIVQPGEWTIGYVYFSNTVPAGTTFDLTAAGTESGSDIFDTVNLKVVEAKLNKSQYGGAEIDGIVSNGGDKALDHGSLLVMCFANGTPKFAESGYTEGSANIPAGGTAPFGIRLPEPDCPDFVIGASGYTTS